MTVVFEGPQVRWIGSRGTSRGIAEVYLNNVLVDTIDLYAPSWQFQQTLYEATGLDNGPHTLTITNTGTIGNGTSPRTEIDAIEAQTLVTAGVLSAEPDTLDVGVVAVGATGAASTTVTNTGGAAVELAGVSFEGADGFSSTAQFPITLGPGDSTPLEFTFTPTGDGPVTATALLTHDGANSPLQIALAGEGGTPPPELVRFEETDGRLVFSEGWRSVTSTNRSEGAAALTSTAGASMTVTFEGPQVRWIGTRGTSRGIAEVYLNNVLVDTIDLYAPSWQWQQVLYETTGLDNGPHTLTIINTDQRNEQATATRTEIDAIEATNLLPPPTP